MRASTPALADGPRKSKEIIQLLHNRYIRIGARVIIHISKKIQFRFQEIRHCFPAKAKIIYNCATIPPQNAIVPCVRVLAMSEYTESEVLRLHEKMAVVYRRGRLTATEQLEIKGLWARIERLETSIVAEAAREARSQRL